MGVRYNENSIVFSNLMNESQTEPIFAAAEDSSTTTTWTKPDTIKVEGTEQQLHSFVEKYNEHLGY